MMRLSARCHSTASMSLYAEGSLRALPQSGCCCSAHGFDGPAQARLCSGDTHRSRACGCNTCASIDWRRSSCCCWASCCCCCCSGVI